jgi:CRP/FNR family transcriptional regulator, polysaccharide utilization system transcription regulator
MPELTCFKCPHRCNHEIFTEEDVRLVNENKIEIAYNSGEMIIKQGSFVSQILFLKAGLVKKVIEGTHERNTILKIVTAGSFIGLPAISNQKTYPFSLFALKPSVICHIHRQCLDLIIARNKDACRYFMEWFCCDYPLLYGRISVLGTRNNHGKLASALMYLRSISDSEPDIFKYISRKDIADLASISLESVNKILAELKNDYIIELNGTKLKILKPELVEKLSTVG